jgi:uncharacterized membrane protein
MIKGKKQGSKGLFGKHGMHFCQEKTVNLGVEKISITAVGRVAYGMAITLFGILHFTNAEPLLRLIPPYLPGGLLFWVYFVGVALVLAGISIIIQKYDRAACLLLALMFALFIAMVRIPYLVKLEDGKKQDFLIQMSKEIALAGSALVIGGRKRKTG